MDFSARTGLAAVLAVPFILAAAARADDWPQWRGLNRDGVWSETGHPRNLSTERIEGPLACPGGSGVFQSRRGTGSVYVTDSELVRPQARERIHAFDETTGQPRWSYAYDVDYPDWAFDEMNPLGPRATPIFKDGMLYSLGMFGNLFCIDATNGEVLWKKDLRAENPGQRVECTASPLIDGDHLIVFVGAKPNAGVIALDKNTGKEVWKALDESITFSSPIIITAGGTRQLIVWTQASVTSLDPATGATLWRERLNTSGDYVVSTPVQQDDLLLIGGLMMKLDPDKPAASVLWPQTRATPARILSNTSTALFRDDFVFSARSSGELVCIDASTGKQVWETDKVTDLKSGASIHITSTGNSVLLFNERGELIWAKLTREGYEELGRFALLEPTYPFGGRNCAWAPPAYANRCVFARNDKELVCASLAAEP